jgi:hypothetical protein
MYFYQWKNMQHNITLCFCGITHFYSPSPPSDEYLPVWCPSGAKIELLSIFQHLIMSWVGLLCWNWLYDDMTSSWCPLMTAWWHMMYTFPLHCEILGWILLLHVQHAVTYFLKLPCVFPLWEAYICDFFSWRYMFVIFLAEDIHQEISFRNLKILIISN